MTDPARKRQRQTEMSKRYADADSLLKFKVACARIRARKNGIPFEITAADVSIPEKCPVLGIPLVLQPVPGKRGNSPSLDRILNDKGYIKGNVAIISDRANMRKGNLTIQEVRNLLAYMEAAERGG